MLRQTEECSKRSRIVFVLSKTHLKDPMVISVLYYTILAYIKPPKKWANKSFNYSWLTSKHIIIIPCCVVYPTKSDPHTWVVAGTELHMSATREQPSRPLSRFCWISGVRAGQGGAGGVRLAAHVPRNMHSIQRSKPCFNKISTLV